MSDTSQHPAPLSRTLFPFPKPGAPGNGQSQTAEANAKDYFQALSQAEDGFFPIGYNGQWHGGIHFGAETGRSLAQDGGIRCIADGQVIAYRIDEDYPTVKYDSCAAATYSRGFVLVRHRLQLPPAPQAAGANGEGTPAADAQPSLLFFSLYMHIRNWNAYKADADLKRPAFWDGSVYLVGERAVDSDRGRNPFIPESGRTGMNIRDANHRITGFAPRGVKLKLGEANPARSSYYRITEVIGGATYPDDVVGMYVYKGTDSSREGLDPVSEPHAKGGVYIPPEPVGIKAGDIVGHLGEYQRYLDMDALAQCSTGRPLAQVDVFTHEDLEGFIAQSRSRDAQLDARQKTLLHVRPGARLVQPSAPDIELAADEAVVQIGDGDGRWVIGRKGTVAIVDQRPADFNVATRTYGDGRIFIAAVNAEGNEITLGAYNALTDKATYPRRKLLTPTGSEVWVSRGTADQQALVTPPGRAWSQFPLQAANAGGEAVGYSRVIPVAAIEESLKEADGTRWFQVDAPTSSGELTRGWVRESGHANVEICSPWAWPGFEIFDVAELEPRELFARELAASGRAQPQERDEFDNAARNIEQSPLFAALGRAIDSDGNREITPLELRNALKTEWLADAISRLVIRYPSEWSDPSDRWSRIDELIEDETLRKDWEHEKGRIGDLAIWPDVAGRHGFPPKSVVHHFHPVGFIENFGSSCPEECVVESYEAETSKGTFLMSKRSFLEMLSDERYEETPYVPAAANTSSGVTIGYGYDLGHQLAERIRSDLASYYSPEDVEALAALAGLTKEKATDQLPSVAGISISRESALNFAFDLKRRYAQETVNIYPEVINLHPHCQGALLSLVFNRGAGSLRKASRIEMGQIQDALRSGAPEEVPGLIRSMKRVWEGRNLGGLIKRREREAVLFEEGVKCKCWK
ncbi:calcium-binding protein [Luteimonas sp. A277]